jgi:hypothetical protein
MIKKITYFLKNSYTELALVICIPLAFLIPSPIINIILLTTSTLLSISIILNTKTKNRKARKEFTNR